MSTSARRVAGLTAAVILTGGLAVSQPVATPSASAAPAARQEQSCLLRARVGVPTVTVHRYRSIRSASVGVIDQQRYLPTACHTTVGARYRLAGCEASNRWLPVSTPRPGWVPRGCVHWVFQG